MSARREMCEDSEKEKKTNIFTLENSTDAGKCFRKSYLWRALRQPTHRIYLTERKRERKYTHIAYERKQKYKATIYTRKHRYYNIRIHI